MKNSELLIKTKRMLQAHPCIKYVCHAIAESAGVDGGRNYDGTYEIRQWVVGLLNADNKSGDPHIATLENWLMVRHGIYGCSFDSDRSKLKMLNTRLDWLDWMIQYWQEQERGCLMTKHIPDATKLRQAMEAAGLQANSRIFNDLHKDGSRRLKYWHCDLMMNINTAQYNTFMSTLKELFGDRIEKVMIDFKCDVNLLIYLKN